MYENIEIEYGGVSAMKFNKFDDKSRSIKPMWIPQIELIRYDAASGDTISQKFVCMPKMECDNELEALKEAIKYRDSL